MARVRHARATSQNRENRSQALSARLRHAEDVEVSKLRSSEIRRPMYVELKVQSTAYRAVRRSHRKVGVRTYQMDSDLSSK